MVSFKKKMVSFKKKKMYKVEDIGLVILDNLFKLVLDR